MGGGCVRACKTGEDRENPADPKVTRTQPPLSTTIGAGQ